MKKPSVISRLLRYVGKYKISCVLIVIFSIISTAYLVLAPNVLGQVTTTLFESVKTKQWNFGYLANLLGALITVYVVASIFGFLQKFFMARVSAKVVENIRDDIDKKMHRMKLNYYDTVPNGEILSTVTNDVDRVSVALNENITEALCQIFQAIGILIMMLSTNVLMALIAVATIPVTMLLAKGVLALGAKQFDKQQYLLGELNGIVEENYNGQAVVQAFNYQERAEEIFQKKNQELQKVSQSAESSAGAVGPMTTMISNLGYTINAVIGCLFALNGTITVGNIQAMLQYAKNFSEPFTIIAGMTGSFSSAYASCKRIFDLLDAEEEIPNPSNPKIPTSNKGTVEFKNVQFGYVPNRLLMTDVNFVAKPGQKIAVVGPTGAGKTTLINLLMRFYEINGGSITVDGVDTREMTREELRKRFGMVLQDTWLFQGTIMDNLKYGGVDIPKERVLEASKTACTDNFIRTLPGEYEMVLDKGAENISQGERQMLTIARAMATDPEIMILDEATSNVDTHTEVMIQSAMKKLMQGRTSFVIAHRLSTIKDANVILYMEQGDIKEWGSHDELMKLNGKYAALYNSQFEK